MSGSARRRLARTDGSAGGPQSGHAAQNCCYGVNHGEFYGIPVYMEREHAPPRDHDEMTMLALSALLGTVARLLNRLFAYGTELLTGIDEARAMALRYQDLAGLSDRELAARGLKREDIPRAVLAASDDI